MKYITTLCFAVALVALAFTPDVNAEQPRITGLRRNLKSTKGTNSPTTSNSPTAATVAQNGAKSMKGGPKTKSGIETTKAPKATKVPKGSAPENTAKSAKSAKLGKSKNTKTAPSVTTTTFAVVVEGCSCTEEVQNAIVEAVEDSLDDPDAVVTIVSCTSTCSSSGRALEDSSTGGTIEVVFTVTTTNSNPEGAINDNLGPELGELGVNVVGGVTVVDSSPTGSPVASPTASPIVSPTVSATGGPTEAPVVNPSANPTTSPTANPSASPSNGPTAEPSAIPSEGPTSVPTVTPSDGPTASPSVEPSTMPTASPSDGPTAAPVPSPSAMPSDSPSDGPTAAPVPSPSAMPSDSPSDGPTAAPIPSPSATPTGSPSDGPTAAPVPSPSATPTDSPSDETSASHTASPSSAPSAAPVTTVPSVTPSSVPSTAPVGASCSNTAFTPIKDNGGTGVDFYYAYDDNDYGYTDDGNGEQGDGTLDQIGNGIDDFTILDNGLMVFGHPWDCDRGTDAGCRNTTLQIFEVFGEDNKVNPLKAEDKVFVKEETDGSLLVSWEGVQGKNGDGDVNVQAQLFSNGDARVCFGCGSLPSDVLVGVKIDLDGFRNEYYPLPTVDFGPTDKEVWPENQCFDYILPITNAPSEAPSSFCSNTAFTPIKDNGGTEVDFFYYANYDDYGYTDDKNGEPRDDDYEYDTLDQIGNGIDDFTILDNGLMVFGNPWGCDVETDAGCRNTTLQIFEVFGEDNKVNPLKAEDKVFVKEETDGSLLVSWEGVQGKNGDGDVNVQAQLLSNGDARVCFGCGSLPSDVLVGVKIDLDGFRNANNPLPTVDFGPSDKEVWPENQCFDYTLPITNAP